MTTCFKLLMKTLLIMENEKPIFSPAEIELLKEDLKRSYKERFKMCTRLYKIQQTMNKAVITHKEFIFK